MHILHCICCLYTYSFVLWVVGSELQLCAVISYASKPSNFETPVPNPKPSWSQKHASTRRRILSTGRTAAAVSCRKEASLALTLEFRVKTRTTKHTNIQKIGSNTRFSLCGQQTNMRLYRLKYILAYLGMHLMLAIVPHMLAVLLRFLHMQ